MAVQYNSLSKFLDLQVATPSASVSDDFLSTLGVVCIRKVGEPSGEDVFEITNKDDIATYTDDTFLEKFFDEGGIKMVLFFLNTIGNIEFSDYNFTIGCIVSSYEAGYDLTTIPTTFVRNKAIETQSLITPADATFSIGYGQTVCYSIAQVGWIFGFYGSYYKNNFAVPVAKDYGTTYTPHTFSDGETADLRSKRFTFLVENLGNGELAFASAGAMALSDFYYLQQLDIAVKNSFKNYLQVNSINDPLAYIDDEIGSIESVLQREVDSFIADAKLNTGVVSIPRRENQTSSDIQAHLLNDIFVDTTRAGAIFYGQGTISSTD